MAAEHGSAAVAEMLLDRGASVDLGDVVRQPLWLVYHLLLLLLFCILLELLQ